MLAYADESANEPGLVVGAGIPTEWLSSPMSARGISTRWGVVDWNWDGHAMQITVRGTRCAVRLGPAFPAKTPTSVRLVKPDWAQ
jgi:hypothetical protein